MSNGGKGGGQMRKKGEVTGFVGQCYKKGGKVTEKGVKC
jgi:hypothetical protein